MSTPCMARVVLKNTTGRAMDEVVLLHVFGDEKTEKLTWDHLGERIVQSASRSVSYSVGFGAMTSYDWWSLTWRTTRRVAVGGCEIDQVYACSTTPSVLNIIGDHFLKQGTAGVGVAGSAATHAAVAAGAASTVVSTGTTATTGMVNFLLGGIVRSVSKRDFYNCNLKQEDAYGAGSPSPELCFVINEAADGRGAISIESSARGTIGEMAFVAVPLPPALEEISA